jgi:hypothetical protein
MDFDEPGDMSLGKSQGVGHRVMPKGPPAQTPDMKRPGTSNAILNEYRTPPDESERWTERGGERGGEQGVHGGPTPYSTPNEEGSLFPNPTDPQQSPTPTRHLFTGVARESDSPEAGINWSLSARKGMGYSHRRSQSNDTSAAAAREHALSLLSLPGLFEEARVTPGVSPNRSHGGSPKIHPHDSPNNLSPSLQHRVVMTPQQHLPLPRIVIEPNSPLKIPFPRSTSLPTPVDPTIVSNLLAQHPHTTSNNINKRILPNRFDRVDKVLTSPSKKAKRGPAISINTNTDFSLYRASPTHRSPVQTKV